MVLAALASGRPVVASSVGGVPELLTERNGLMVPADNPHALARALDAALNREWNPDELRASVPSLSWDAYGRLFFDLVRASVLSERPHQVQCDH